MSLEQLLGQGLAGRDGLALRRGKGGEKGCQCGIFALGVEDVLESLRRSGETALLLFAAVEQLRSRGATPTHAN